MSIKDFYEAINGNYENAKARLATDERIEKYLRKFPSFVDLDCLTKAVNEKDYSAVFTISHDIKGMCLNLELTPLSESSSALCESVRHGTPTVDILPLFNQFKKDYSAVLTELDKAFK